MTSRRKTSPLVETVDIFPPAVTGMLRPASVALPMRPASMKYESVPPTVPKTVHLINACKRCRQIVVEHQDVLSRVQAQAVDDSDSHASDISRIIEGADPQLKRTLRID